jgi:asparagine synthase (glutamine-hydrolysing)
MISDAPVGLLLSGGMDSTTIAHYLHKKGLNLNTFSVGFKDWPKSEHLDARIVAEEFNTIHHELMVENEFSSLIDELVYFFDEPLGGAAFVPTYLVSKLASQHVKVILGGHGGDEVLAGYTWHHYLNPTWSSNPRSKMKRLVYGDKRFLLDTALKFRAWTKWHYQDLNKLMSPEFFNQMPVKQNSDFFSAYYDPIRSPIKNAQSIDLSLFNNEFNLSFLDKASMANSVEGRVPFLDHKLVEWVLSLDEKAYFKHGENKNILKQLLKPHIPDKILHKPKKGFGFKVHHYLPLDQMQREIRASDCFSKSGMFNHTFLNQVFQSEHPSKIWSLYIFSKWFDHWNAQVGISF